MLALAMFISLLPSIVPIFLTHDSSNNLKIEVKPAYLNLAYQGTAPANSRHRSTLEISDSKMCDSPFPATGSFFRGKIKKISVHYTCKNTCMTVNLNNFKTLIIHIHNSGHLSGDDCSMEYSITWQLNRRTKPAQWQERVLPLCVSLLCAIYFSNFNEINQQPATAQKEDINP